MKGKNPLLLYLFAISLLAVSSTLSFILAYQGLENRENDATVVNLAGRQRMLSQRIAKDCLILQNTDLGMEYRRNIENNLKRSLGEWQMAYLQLSGKMPIKEVTVRNSDSVKDLFNRAEQPFHAIKNAAFEILGTVNFQNRVAMNAILENDPEFLRNMDEIVMQYQIESTTKIKQLGQLEKSLWVFTLLLLGTEVVVIFIPLHRHISRSLKEKNDKNQLLLDKQHELENSLAAMQQMQQNLLEAEKLATLGETVGIIAHEINTPIGIAVTAASFLKEQTLGFSQQYEQQQLRKSSLETYVGNTSKGCSLILDNLEKAAKLLSDFKDIAVLQLNGRQERFNVGALIRQVLNTLEPLFKNTEVKLQLELTEHFEIESYPGVFAQIVMNLVTNSLRHGFPVEPKKGTISIRLSSDSHRLCLRYQDNGVGIPVHLLSMIFEPFFSTNKQKGGSGLGLSIVQTLVVKQLSGTITCNSQPGEGVLFEIRIPIEQ